METATDIDFNEVVPENKALAKFDVSLAAIAEMGKKYGALTIAGVNDKAGYTAVHNARMVVKNKRLDVVQFHKEGKAEALQACRDWDTAKNILLAGMEPIEERLAAEEKRIDDEKAYIAAENQRKIDAMVNTRAEAFKSVNAQFDFTRLATMSEADFQAHYSLAKAEFDKAEEAKAAQAAELERLRKLEAEQKAKEAAEMEAKRKELEAQQAEINRQRAEQEAVAAKQRAEAERLEREKREAEEAKRREAEAKERAAELEKAKEAARLDAIAETERKAKAEQEAKEKREAAERAEAERLAALAPEREKVCKCLEEMGAVLMPEVKDKRLQGILNEVGQAIAAALAKV